MKTRGNVITGLEARLYNSQNFLNGAFLVYSRIIRLMMLNPGDKVLDVGCGTGTVLFRLYRKYGDRVSLYGIDPSGDMIQIAISRNKKLNAKVNFQKAIGESIPFKSGLFDWVMISLVMHHLPFEAKVVVIREARRVLKQGGKLLLSDFGKPQNLMGSIIAFIARGHAFMKENIRGDVNEILKRARFKKIKVLGRQFGLIAHTIAEK